MIEKSQAIHTEPRMEMEEQPLVIEGTYTVIGDVQRPQPVLGRQNEAIFGSWGDISFFIFVICAAIALAHTYAWLFYHLKMWANSL